MLPPLHIAKMLTWPTVIEHSAPIMHIVGLAHGRVERPCAAVVASKAVGSAVTAGGSIAKRRMTKGGSAAGKVVARKKHKATGTGEAVEVISMDLPVFTLPAGTNLSGFETIRQVNGRVHVQYGRNMVWYGEDEEVLALYVIDACSAEDNRKMLGLLKDTYDKGQGSPRSDNKTVRVDKTQGRVVAANKMVMGGWREVIGNRPDLVYGWYAQPPAVKKQQVDMADTFCTALGKHPVLCHVLARFKAGASVFNPYTDGVGLIPHTPITTISTTRDYKSASHIDQDDGPCGSVVGWFDEGMELPCDEGYFSAPFILGLQKEDTTNTITLRPQSGSMLWIHSTKVYHQSGECKVFLPGGEVDATPYHRYGTAIACKPKVLRLAVKRSRQFKEALQYMKQEGTYGGSI